MAGFDENDRKIDFNPPKSSKGIELSGFSRNSELHRPSQVPIVMNVLRLSHELVMDRAPTRPTSWEFFSANYDGLVRSTMTA